MKLGIMQPYLFPYIGYFQLMNAVDHWIVFDNIQFIDKGWINRNRILHPEVEKEWQYITIPLSKRGQFDKICDINISSDINWHGQMLGKLTSYKKAPYYNQTVDFLQHCFDTDELNLSKLVVRTLKMTADYIGITTPIDVQSEMDMPLGIIEHPGQWALRISEALGATEYINPYGGAEIFKHHEFETAGIDLSFLKPSLNPYPQRRAGFTPGLSIIDILMFNNISDCKKMLNDFTLVSSLDYLV